MTTPTQRSLAHFRKLGYWAEVVEKWVPMPGGPPCPACHRPLPRPGGPPGIRKDLFGWVDIVALDPVTGTLTFCQTTSGSNAPARVAKTMAWEGLGALLLAPELRRRAVVHSWAKRVGDQPRGSRPKWSLREVDVQPLQAPGGAPQQAPWDVDLPLPSDDAPDPGPRAAG